MTYPTEHYKNSGIPYCEKCGESYHTNTEGDRICPESLPDCEFTPKQEQPLVIPPSEVIPQEEAPEQPSKKGTKEQK